MATIDKNRSLLTLINVFTGSPENQDKLVTLLAEATTQTMRRLPGFVSAGIHRSLDGTKWSTSDVDRELSRSTGW
jgi:hypothetical protein